MLRLQTPWYQQSYIRTFSKSLGSLLARLGRESQDFQGWKLFGMVGFEDGFICD